MNRFVTILIPVILTGLMLSYGILDMPDYGDPDAPIHKHVAPHYIVDSLETIGIPNFVTSVLGSYRGYDTFGETTVILAAAVGAMLLLGGSTNSRSRKGTMSDGTVQGKGEGGE